MDGIVLVVGGRPATTSLAIAEGVGNPHSSVIKLIRQNISDLEEFGNIGFEIQNSTSGAGRPTEYALLNEQQATLLMTYMRNNTVVREFKKRLVKAFYEISKPAVPQTYPEALRLAAKLAEQTEAQKKEIEELTPKAEALGRIAKADGSLCITNAAKDLQVRPKDLFGWLSQNRWIYRRTGNVTWTAYQSRIEQGYLEHKVTVVEKDDGTDKTIEQVRVTAKGLTRLAALGAGQRGVA